MTFGSDEMTGAVVRWRGIQAMQKVKSNPKRRAKLEGTPNLKGIR
jgi:hypothetical protein